MEVYLDGGIRKGTDVLKAIALGAKAVFVGRPALWGLAYDVSITATLDLMVVFGVQKSGHFKDVLRPSKSNVFVLLTSCLGLLVLVQKT